MNTALAAKLMAVALVVRYSIIETFGSVKKSRRNNSNFSVV
jgi:hypothetical protein